MCIGFFFHGALVGGIGYFPPVARRGIGRRTVEFSTALVDGVPSQRVETGGMQPALSGLHNQPVMSQFAQGIVDGFGASPSFGPEDRHCRAQVAIVFAVELPRQVAEQLDGRATARTPVWAILHRVGDGGEGATVAAPPVFKPATRYHEWHRWKRAGRGLDRQQWCGLSQRQGRSCRHLGRGRLDQGADIFHSPRGDALA